MHALERYQAVNALITIMKLDERYIEMSTEDVSEEVEMTITEAMMDEARGWIKRNRRDQDPSNSYSSDLIIG